MKFEMGFVCVTCGVSKEMEVNQSFQKFVHESVVRYGNCDWGNLDDEDKKLNDEALENGDRILAAYNFDSDLKIWIITEWDRSATTVLFPYEY